MGRLLLVCLVLLVACRREVTMLRPDPAVAQRGPLVLESDPEKLVVRRIPSVRRRRTFHDGVVDSDLELLRKRDEVDAPHVGIGGAPSQFFVVADANLPQIASTDLEWLLDDDFPAVRAFGLTAATVVGERFQLVAHVCDREPVSHTHGCLGSNETVGTIAFALIRDPHWLGTFGLAIPKASSEELAALEARTLATDGCHPPRETRLTHDRQLEQLGWEELERLAPTVPTWVLAKALGRVVVPKVGKLAHVLDDTTASPGARVAAASGLTRSSKPEAEAAILRQEGFLDGVRAGLSRELRATIVARRKLEELMAPIHAVHTWMETEKLAANALAALAIESVVVLDEALDDISYGDSDATIGAARAKALRWVLTHASEHAACWDTWRDVPYVLEGMIRLRKPESLGFSPAEALTFKAQVQAAVDRLDAAPCP